MKPDQQSPEITPLGLTGSILLFGIPALILVGFVYIVIPALSAAGIYPFMAYLVGLLIPLILMFVAALVAYRLEGRPFSWAGIRERYRLTPMTGRDWLWAIGLSVFSFFSYGLLVSGETWLIASGVIPLPDGIPTALDPRVLNTLTPDTLNMLLGGHIQGNWGFVSVYFVLLFFNIFGEELWWRGYILPRQEKVFGQRTWLVHGVMWALFHVFKWWDVVALLPVTLALSYVAQRRKNTWPGIISHYVTNGLGFVGLALVIAGVVKF